MHNVSSVLAIVGSLCLTLTLGLAWCLVGVRSSAFMKKVFPSYQQLLKAHIDYLLMSALLMIFCLLFAHFQVSASLVVVTAMCVGSLMNPVGSSFSRSSQILDSNQPARSPPSWRAASH